MSIAEAVDTSINAAIEDGRLDAIKHAAPIEALKALADRADVASEKDNVTFPTMLKYMASLGLLPNVQPQAEQPAESSLASMRNKFGAKYRVVSGGG